jgi:hypothetical protein
MGSLLERLSSRKFVLGAAVAGWLLSQAQYWPAVAVASVWLVVEGMVDAVAERDEIEEGP